MPDVHVRRVSNTMSNASALLARAVEIMQEYPQANFNEFESYRTKKWYELPSDNQFVFAFSHDGGHIQLTAFMPSSVFGSLEIDAISRIFYFWDDTANWNIPILDMTRPTANGLGHITFDFYNPHVVERVIRHLMRVILARA